MPLAEPYDYYARAALLHADAVVATAASDPQACERYLLEARDALLAALEVPARNGGLASAIRSFGHAKTMNPRAPRHPMEAEAPVDEAAADPRVWYLLGLVLSDLGSLADARQVYRQVLRRLPACVFSIVVHFNLACVEAQQAGRAARATALRELKELRRLCRGFHPGCETLTAVSGASASHACELCGVQRCT